MTQITTLSHDSDGSAWTSSKVRSVGLSQCAREDSNLHGELSPQGPQPCASTNSATGAEGASIAPAEPATHGGRIEETPGRAPGGGTPVDALYPSTLGATVRTRV